MPDERVEHAANEGFVDPVAVHRVTKVAHKLAESRHPKILEVPDSAIESAVSVVATANVAGPDDLMRALSRFYPYKLFGLEPSEEAAVSTMLGLPAVTSTPVPTESTGVDPVGTAVGISNTDQPWVTTLALAELKAEISQSLGIGRDVCLVAKKGEGKTAMVEAMAAEVGRATQTIYLYRDMTSRDLLQQRYIDAGGNTDWKLGPAIVAATRGDILVLDGIDRLESDTLSCLHQLIVDRTLLGLPDGSRLLRHDRFDAVRRSLGIGLPEMAERGLLRCHPDFQVIALATPPSRRYGQSWLTAETMGLFSFHQLPSGCNKNHQAILQSLFPRLDPMTVDMLTQLSARLQSEANMAGGGPVLSARQLIRISKRLTERPSQFREMVSRTVLAPLLPELHRDQLEHALTDVLGEEPVCLAPPIEHGPAVTDNGRLTIGGVTMDIATPTAPELVPQTLFHDNPAHNSLLAAMMQDLTLGERSLMLIGPQGTGKNKLTDHLLQLLRWEREYIQLHRDTTVLSLTVEPRLEAGRVSWGDTPLVAAARYGRVLVIDEADKAPLEVVNVLKGLVEDGQMLLADGRRILRPELCSNATVSAGCSDNEIISIHPNFKVIALANPAGFPFLGNDFFSECGDVFAVHVVENPDEASQRGLLRAYGPDICDSTVSTLVGVFDKLRKLNAEGLLAYPFSTREQVNIVKHLQQYPVDGIAAAVENVLAFDRFDDDVVTQVSKAFRQYGVSLSTSANPEFAVMLSESSKHISAVNDASETLRS